MRTWPTIMKICVEERHLVVNESCAKLCALPERIHTHGAVQRLAQSFSGIKRFLGGNEKPEMELFGFHDISHWGFRHFKCFFICFSAFSYIYIYIFNSSVITCLIPPPLVLFSENRISYTTIGSFRGHIGENMRSIACVLDWLSVFLPSCFSSLKGFCDDSSPARSLALYTSVFIGRRAENDKLSPPPVPVDWVAGFRQQFKDLEKKVRAGLSLTCGK